MAVKRHAVDKDFSIEIAVVQDLKGKVIFGKIERLITFADVTKRSAMTSVLICQAPCNILRGQQLPLCLVKLVSFATL